MLDMPKYPIFTSRLCHRLFWSSPFYLNIHDVGECLMAFLNSSKVKPVHLVFVVFCQVVLRQTSSGGLWGIMHLTRMPNLSLGTLRE